MFLFEGFGFEVFGLISVIGWFFFGILGECFLEYEGVGYRF